MRPPYLPLLFLIQVGPSPHYHCLISNDLCLVVLPGPKVLSILYSDCLTVLRQLLLLSGDMELNPGPRSAPTNNLVFHGLNDSSSETWAKSEALVTDLCKNNLGMEIPPHAIERAHRIGRYQPNRRIPIIVKFASYKTDESVMSAGRFLKDTGISVTGDYSLTVRTARKHLLGFAKSQSAPFKLRFDKLLLNGKLYTFNHAT
ncbi:uncharacterized protein LOC135400418 [Ornithodoros turicata]|uniref:uncharacterized protein LOC135400418 n=1 Tax=Ornithodoros turicata TaxID=34597 RepID=UPI0031388870